MKVRLGSMLLISVMVCGLSSCTSAPERTERTGAPSKPGSSISKAESEDSASDNEDHSAEDAILKKYSLKQMHAAASKLLVTFDMSLDKKKPAFDTCGISGEKAKAMLMPLKALIDQKVEDDREVYVQDPTGYLKANSTDRCDMRCECGATVDVLQGFDMRKFDPPERKQNAVTLREAKKRVTAMTNVDRARCAQAEQWFCKSDLKTYLEKELANYGQ